MIDLIDWGTAFHKVGAATLKDQLYIVCQYPSGTPIRPQGTQPKKLATVKHVQQVHTLHKKLRIFVNILDLNTKIKAIS